MLSWNSFASLLFAMVILAVPVALGDLHDPYGMLEGLNHHPLPPEDIPFSEDPPDLSHQNYSLDDLDDLFLDEMGNEDRPMKKIECLLLIEKENLFSSQEKREIGNLDEEAMWCNRSWDSILCWPPTAAGTLGVLPCFDELNGIKYNTSHEDEIF
ncbi:hypothetical protein J437_LFUL002621 [Ladona fulva]|uniref:G-protein coupled receptors family 2 profile 1 domain-containing protein n=1 Tax=Ladona fulva TaxID=123851 RepID=A0A8K0JVH6_LADFU|nr:hypothetical protein J437_LFUL002621 [Ladona fulva]